MKKWTWILLVCVSMSCERSPTRENTGGIGFSTAGIFIVNEGLFNNNNAGLDYYDTIGDSLYRNVYQIVNQKSLGDIANQMVLVNNRGYIVVNNSNRIVVIDSKTYQEITTINWPQVFSPYNMALLDTFTAVVTNLYANSVSLLNLQNNTIQGNPIPVGNSPEGIGFSNGKFYIANSGFGSGNTVSVLNSASWTVTNSVRVGFNPQRVAVSGNSVFVMCSGGFSSGQYGGIYRINSATDAVTDSIRFDSYIDRIAFSPAGTGYFIYGSRILKFSTSGLLADTTQFIISASPYGIDVNPENNDVIIGDSRNKQATIYTSGGVEKKTLPVGDFPGSFAFKKK